MGCYVIAEAGVNHNGSQELALRLVEIAAAAGADAVKFQTFRAERVVGVDAPKADYQTRATGPGDQRSMLRGLELGEAAHRALFARCRSLGIEFISTPFDEESAEFLVSLGVQRIKVPSGELTNQPFIEKLAAFGLPLILSTGMSTLEEASEAVSWVKRGLENNGAVDPLKSRVTLLHCTSSYPTEPEDVNLRAMLTLGQELQLPVGYSDHTLGIAVATAAAALGATVIEKHFTSDRRLPGPDHRASLEPDELAKMVSAVRCVERALGDGVKLPRPVELSVRDAARRSLTARRDLVAGHCLKRDDLDILRPGTGIPPKSLTSVLGRQLSRPVRRGATLTWEDLVE